LTELLTLTEADSAIAKVSFQPHCSVGGKLTSWLTVHFGSYLFPDVYEPVK